MPKLKSGKSWLIFSQLADMIKSLAEFSKLPSFSDRETKSYKSLSL